MNVRLLVVVAFPLLAGLGLGLHALARPTVEPLRLGSATADDGQEKDARPHPLDPLSADEIRTAVRVVADHAELPEGVLYPVVTLHEPPKEEVYAFKPGGRVRRRAFVVAFHYATSKVFEAVVDLGAKKIVDWKRPAGVQPRQFGREFTDPPRLVKADPRWRQAMKRRGIAEKEFDDLELHSMSAGYLERADLKAVRVGRVLTYRRGQSKNPYPRVVEGVVALVNLTEGKVLEVVDHNPVVPVATEAFDIFDDKVLGKPRTGLKPLRTTMPDGPSFTVAGKEVRWQNWRFRFSLNPREGLVLHTVGYEDGGRLRPVLYRAAMAEMVVPYGDPSEGWRWRAFFDAGEYGLGAGVGAQRRGIEVPGYARLFSFHFADDAGKPELRQDAVALYEQDGGILWSHADSVSGAVQTRRARQLVVQAICTLGNYDYVSKWVFGQDGSLEAQVEMTGILLAKGVSSDVCQACKQTPDDEGKVRGTGDDRHGVLVARRVVAVNHQHHFCFRLDLDVDGPANSLHEVSVVPEAPTAANPEGNGFLVETRLLRTEREACRPHAGAAHRAWKVVNPDPKKRTTLGHAPGYQLEPAPAAPALARPESRLRQRARFLDYPLWATRYRPGEQYPAGAYVNHNPGGDGLPRWIRGNASLENADLVLWYTCGLTHVARPEEWPVMPVARTGFRLVPHGFFERNPALDVPAERK